ncbi:MAG: autotransporter outer membrane beta-barrel domain-containing protein, partial [Rhodobacteraceae bacterium]|nr:autotransporter outer membrane beta-barrel domain-containing protein [Paracoccaceae bacterium]
IYARAAGTMLTIDTQGAVTGTTNGIVARNTGTGLMSVTTAGVVGGTGGFGMYLRNDGINALTVAAVSAVSGGALDGIYARSGATATDMTIAATTVTGGRAGISARNNGTGALAITAMGMASGTTYGIDARNVASGTSLTVNAANASGGQSGIFAQNVGSGATRIAVAAGGVAEGATSGITARHASGAAFDIVVDGRVQNRSGATDALAVQASTTGRGVTVQNNSNTIIGTVNLTAADDMFNNIGTWQTAGGTSDFGAGSDLLNNAATGLIDVADAAGVAEFTSLNALEQFTSAGRLTLQDGGVGDRLVTTGNYTGADGTLLLDAVLQAGGTADVLRVDGNVTGTSLLAVANAGGTGGLTTGDGILVVDVGGTSTSTAFALAGGPLNVGTFRYDLDYGGAANSNQNWYLVARSNGGDAIWEPTPSILMGSFTNMPTLQQRVGERLGRPDLEQTEGPWARLIGTRGWQSPEQSDAGSNWSYANWGLQAGIDSAQLAIAGGNWVLGATAQVGEVNADVANTVAVGTIHAQGIGVGATATWYGNNGFYSDLQAQATYVNAGFADTKGAALATRQGMFTYGASAEAGWRKTLANGSVLIPQVQLAWGALDGSDFDNSLGAHVDLGNNDRAKGRIGLAWEHTQTDGNKFYMIGNLERDLSGSSMVLVDGTASRQNTNAIWASLGVGSTITFGENKSAYAEGSYKAAVDTGSGKNEAFGLTAGLRLQW